VLDRPNPIGGVAVQGNVRPATGELAPFVGFLPVPMRHGMTLGELVRLASAEFALAADVAVVPAAGWRRERLYDETGLRWVRPSPAMPELESALHYPGLCLFEGTNVSVGRGTALAFQVVGAPWLEPRRVLEALGVGEGGSGKGEGLAGVEIAPVEFTPVEPTDAKYGGVTVPGLRLRVTDRSRYDPTRAALALIAALRAVHPDSFRFRAERFDLLTGDPEVRAALSRGVAPAALWRAWDGELRRFKNRRAKYLLY